MILYVSTVMGKPVKPKTLGQKNICRPNKEEE